MHQLHFKSASYFQMRLQSDRSTKVPEDNASWTNMAYVFVAPHPNSPFGACRGAYRAPWGYTALPPPSAAVHSILWCTRSLKQKCIFLVTSGCLLCTYPVECLQIPSARRLLVSRWGYMQNVDERKRNFRFGPIKRIISPEFGYLFGIWGWQNIWSKVIIFTYSNR